MRSCPQQESGIPVKILLMICGYHVYMSVWKEFVSSWTGVCLTSIPQLPDMQRISARWLVCQLGLVWSL